MTTTEVSRSVQVRLGHAAVITTDLDRFRRFYEDVVGLRLVTIDEHEGAPFRRVGAFADSAGRSLSLLVFEIPGYNSGLPDDLIGRRGRVDHLAFLADDEDQFAAGVLRLVDAGATSGRVDDIGPVRSVLFTDPDGGCHNLQVAQPGYRPGPNAIVPDPGLLAELLS